MKSLFSLPPGRWMVTAASPWLVAVPAQELVLGSGDRPSRLVFAARRATSVRLSMRTQNGAPFVAPPAALPPLTVGSDSIACVDLTKIVPAPQKPTTEMGRPRRSEAVVLGYGCVPMGRADLHTKDREVEGELQFLPFDPQPSVCVDVLPDGRSEVAIQVEPRALLDLRACERGGREDVNAQLQVYAGQRRVRSLEQRWRHRWQSFLPPGDYRVVVDRHGRKVEHFVRVDRSDQQLRLRP